MDGVIGASGPLCCLENVDIVHMLTVVMHSVKCVLQCGRTQTVSSSLTWALSNRIKDPKTLVQLIVDCRKLVPDVLPDNTELLNTTEVLNKIVVL